jgi:Ser-tRNA(Ala) deacylase AlaX
MDQRGALAVFDQTVFCPQGGGQPCDQGMIVIGGKRMPVSFVRTEDGEILHYGEFPSAEARIGDEAYMEIDEIRRMTNARIHTAGHLIAAVVELMMAPLAAVKGYHFPEGPYIEFQGSRPGNNNEFLAKVNVAIETALQAALAVTVEWVSPSALESRGLRLPEGRQSEEPLRVVRIGAYPPVPCGGTHVRCLTEITGVSPSKIKAKGGNLRVSYKVG